MKFLKVGAVAAVLATMSLVGCSATDGNPSASDKSSSISFHLKTSNGIQIDAVNYDLTTAANAEVVNGSIPVPGDDPATGVPLLGISSLGAGAYALEFTATSTDGAYTCDSGKVGFTLAASQDLTLPTITLQCTTVVQVDTTSSVEANVDITTSQQTVGSVIETFTYGPRTVNGSKQGNACVFPPVALKIANGDASIAYSWAASPDGNFTLNATNTQGTYNCASAGAKTLTLTGVKGGQTSTKQITVTCSDTACSFECGNGIKEGSEQCDEQTPRCTNPSTGMVDCQIHPVCGDNVVDAPETCEPPNTATCDASCQVVVATPTCGDGVVNQASEQCDNGMANSDTAPDACRTTCKSPSCGDGVTDPSDNEQCDPPNGTTCDSSCKSIAQATHVACVNCLTADAVDGPLEQQYCSSDPTCVAAQNCVIDAKCFNPIPALCYCGITDAGACSADSFTPTGPCIQPILAGAGNLVLGATGTNNSALERFFDPSYPLGVGLLLLNDAATTAGTAGECNSACFPQ